MSKLSKKLSVNRVLSAVLVLLASVGLIDSLYLTITHYTQALVPCNFTHGCETVLHSSYSELLGFPVAGLGVVFYLVALFITIHFMINHSFHKYFVVWTSLGLLSTLYFLGIQAFVLPTWCQYCLLSATTSIAIFTLSVILLVINKENKNGKNLRSRD